MRLALQGDTGAARAAVEARLAGPAGAARSRLAEAFGLSATAMDLLDLACALAADPGLAEAYAAAQGAPHRVCPTEALARRLFDRAAEAGGNEPVWRAGAPLAVWGFLVPIARTAAEPDSFEADPRVTDWLRGMIGLDAALVSRAYLVEPQRPFAAWPVAATLRNVVRALEAGRPVRVVVTGPAGSGRATFAAAVAAGVNRRALVIDPAGAEDFPELLMKARRLARMADFVLVWRHYEGLRLPRHPPAPPLECVAAGPRARVAPVEGTTDLVAPLPSPDRDERKALWRRLVSEAAAWPASALDALAARPGVAVGDIVEVARGVPQGPDDALARLRARARASLGDAARVLTPRLRWDDLVLPAPTREALEEIAFETAARLRLLAEPEAGRLYAHSGVLAALFSGPPGTGKTMAAEAIADSLGADLLLVDVAATVSKYIGETAKNLSRAFDEAAASGAILLFDEADALFAKRTEIKDLHDRHANADTNYLLHLLENFDGLAILATNRRANMDPAFVRRIRHVVEFARPAAAERRVIWRRAVAALAGEERAAALGGLLDALADQHELTAAQIKNAALTARYAAMREGGLITEAQIRRGLGRELIKDGRPVDAPARGARGRNGDGEPAMPETGYSQTPKVQRGALVQLVPDVIGVLPNIVTFQYNPEKITRGLEPWNPFEVDQTKRGSQAPTVQPYDPEETFSFSLEFDAADGLEDGNPITVATGVAARLAALKKLTLPTKGLIGDLAASAKALFGGPSSQAVRPTVPILLLVLGPGVILPVRITRLSVEETLFSPLLYPLQATVARAEGADPRGVPLPRRRARTHRDRRLPVHPAAGRRAGARQPRRQPRRHPRRVAVLTGNMAVFDDITRYVRFASLYTATDGAGARCRR